MPGKRLKSRPETKLRKQHAGEIHDSKSMVQVPDDSTAVSIGSIPSLACLRLQAPPGPDNRQNSLCTTTGWEDCAPVRLPISMPFEPTAASVSLARCPRPQSNCLQATAIACL